MTAVLTSWLLSLKPANNLLIVACIIVIVPFFLWRGLRLGRFVPLVVVQIFSGILLGPSMLGALEPELHAALFNQKSLDGVNAVAIIAVCLYGFLAGTDIDREVIVQSGRSVAAIGAGGMILTWLLGSLAAVTIVHAIPEAMGKTGRIELFAFCFGLCVAVPALSVLAVILRELDINQTRLGAVALASAGLSSALMWLSLAIILPFAARDAGMWRSAAIAIFGICLTYGYLRIIANPLFERLLKQNAPERVIMSFIAITIFACSAITAVVDLHPVLGAFAAGLFLPDRIRNLAADKLDMPTAMVLMPFFFLSTGLKTSFSWSDASNSNVWQIFSVAMFFSLFGKVFSCAITGRLAGQTWPFSTTIGILLQTKGLVGLVVVDIFLQKGIFSQMMFSSLVIVGLVSTAITVPLMAVAMSFFGDRLKADCVSSQGRPK